jgi:hypothetical protein
MVAIWTIILFILQKKITIIYLHHAFTHQPSQARQPPRVSNASKWLKRKEKLREHVSQICFYYSSTLLPTCPPILRKEYTTI